MKRYSSLLICATFLIAGTSLAADWWDYDQPALECRGLYLGNEDVQVQLNTHEDGVWSQNSHDYSLERITPSVDQWQFDGTWDYFYLRWVGEPEVFHFSVQLTEDGCSIPAFRDYPHPARVKGETLDEVSWCCRLR